ncbi:MAG: ISKra4 family transposase [Egibacteraceae bacterium]
MAHRSASGAEALGDLEAYLARAARRRLSLSEVESESVRRGREVVRLGLQAHLDARGVGDVGPALVLGGPDGPVRLGYKRLHSRRIVSLAGELRVTRMGYGAPGQASIHPLDAELALPGRSFSYGVQRHLVRSAVCGPFDEAVRAVAEMTGVKIPKRSAEQMVIDAAVDVDAFYQARAGCSLLTKGDLVVGAIDCKGIPMVKPEPTRKVARRKKGEKPQKKKMATVAAVFAAAPRRRSPEAVVASLFADDPAPSRKVRQRPKDKRVWASLLAGKDAFISDVGAEMTRRDPRHRHTWVIVTDGERALQRRVINNFTDITLVLDLLHVTEKLWKVGNALHPEGSPEATSFVRERAERVLRGEVSQVVKGLRLIVTKRRLRGAKAKTITDVANYLYANRDRMRYHEYLNKGWPIASGAVEGACKCLVRDRLERSGMRWTPNMAEAMLKLRAVHLSDDWDTYWKWHVQQDQLRLYRKDTWRVVRK